MLPAWIGLSRRWVYCSIATCFFWWMMGLWFYWGQSPQFDESTYVQAAFSWLEFDFSHLSAGEMGTLVRPYIYPLFIAVVLNTSTILLDYGIHIRIIVSLVQLILYVSSVTRLSQIVLARFDRNASNAVLVGLLATPFPIFTQVEILSEGLSMSAFCWLAGALIRLDDRSIALRQLPRRGLVILLMVILVLIRSSFVPVALMTALWVILPVILLIGNQEASKQWWRLIVAVPVVTVGLLVALPQTYLMVEHARIAREDPYFWGVGGAQLHWSMNVAKYSTSMIECASLTKGGIKYPMPELVNWLSFSDELIWESSASVILWYLSHPLAFIIHVFEAVNYDFPTAYVTVVNWPLMLLFNIFSIYIFLVGLLVHTKLYYKRLMKSIYISATKVHINNSHRIYAVISITLVTGVMSIIDSVMNTLIFTYAWGVLGSVLFGIICAFKKADRYLGGVVYLQLLVAVLWIQTGFTAVETRFGIVPWCAFAVLGAYGVIKIGAVSGGGSRSGGRLLGTALGLAGVGLLLSQWILGGVVPVQEAIAAGC